MANGFVAPGFETVSDLVDSILETTPEKGLGVSALVKGEPVIDLWAGESAPGVAWTQDTLVCTFSATKGAAALVMQILYDRGELDLHSRVADHWPEFANNGKSEVLVWHVLTHTAGVPMSKQFEEWMMSGDFATNQIHEVERLIVEAPLEWEPGAQGSYHATTYGTILGRVVESITGRSLGTFFHEEVAVPLDLEFWIGLPEQLHNRVADSLTMPSLPPDMPWLHTLMNQTWMRSAEMPAGNGIGTAKALARMYAPLAGDGSFNGHQLVSSESIQVFSDLWFEGNQVASGDPMRSALGYHLFSPESREFGISERAFGHAGAGGSLGFADPASGLSFGLVKNQLMEDMDTSLQLVKAITAAIQ